MTVRFAPTVTGNYVGDIFRIDYDDGTLAAPVFLDYGVEGDSDTPALIAITPVADPFTFPTSIHSTTVTHTWTLTNSGNIGATGITLSGLAAPFALDGPYPGAGGDCPVAGTLAGLSSCLIGVRFAPNDVGTGVNNYNDDLIN